MTGGNNTRRAVASAALACLAILIAYTTLVSVGRSTHGFSSYYAAARALLAGEFGAWVYEDQTFREYVQDLTGTNVLEIFTPNTPAMAGFALPVAAFDPMTARTVWLLLSLVALTAGVVTLAREAPRSNRAVIAGTVALALLNPGVFANLQTGQAYLITFAALALAADSLVRRRDTLAGAILGLTFVLKPTAAALLLLLVLQRRYRALACALAAGTAAVLFSLPFVTMDAWLRWPRAVLEFVARPATSVTAYQTTVGFFRHFCVADVQWNPAPPLSCEPAAVIAPPLILVTAFLITAYVARRASTALWVSAGICLSLLSVPIAEDHQFVVLAIPLFTLIATAPRSHWPWMALFAILWMLPPAYTIQRYTAGWSALLAYPRLFATWLLWALTIRAMVHGTRRSLEGAADASVDRRTIGDRPAPVPA